MESSVLVRTFSPIGIPGLLQTVDYVRALFTTGGEVTAADEAGAQQRVANQSVLTEDADRMFVTLMPEGSLGWTLLPPSDMTDQIDHIAALRAVRHPGAARGVW
ncbi:MAG: Scr1 family TA system antitoxin-like transcriptional regulator [Pseudonocardiaceae bacterium]